MYNFWVQNWLLYKGLYDYNHLRGYIANVVAQPALMVMMYALMGRYAMDAKTSIFIAVGINVSSISYNVISGITRSYANDRWYSMFSILYITRVNRFWNYTARSILYYPTGLLSGIVGHCDDQAADTIRFWGDKLGRISSGDAGNQCRCLCLGGIFRYLCHCLFRVVDDTGCCP